MQKKKQVFTWPLSTLVIIVSFLSVLVILQQVQAAWIEPSYLPGDTNLANNFVFTPLAQDLDLGTKQIIKTGNSNFAINPGGATGLKINGTVGAEMTGTTAAALFKGQICFNDTTPGNCISSWPSSGGGAGSSGTDWQINYGVGAMRPLYYTTSTALSNGYVGIGTNAPNRLLHIKSAAGANNAEIDIQSGNAPYWGIYQSESTNNLRFYSNAAPAGDRLTFTSDGKVGIATTTPGAALDVTSSLLSSQTPTIRAITWQNSLYGAVADTDNMDGGQISFVFGATEADDALVDSNGLQMFQRGFTIRDQNAQANRLFISPSGNIGIGTSTPNSLLHLYKADSSAEIDIQSVAGTNNHWAIYNDKGTDQLRFWKSAGGNVLTLANNGRVGIGTTNLDNSYMLNVTTATAGVVGVYSENTATDWSFLPDLNPNNIGVKGVARTGMNGGVGVYGSGFYGVKGVGGASGAGVYGEATGGGKAALFKGPTEIEGILKVTGSIQVTGTDNFILITNGSGAPTASCSIGGLGKLYLDYTNIRFYVCTNSGWKSTLLN